MKEEEEEEKQEEEADSLNERGSAWTHTSSQVK
jgi:hypothetical protein